MKNAIFRSKKKSNKDIIVFTTEAIGDNLLFLDAFREFEKIAQKKERELFLICGEKMQNFWLDNRGSDNTSIIPIDLCEFRAFSGHKLISKLTSMICDTIIVPMHHTESLMIGAMIKAGTYLTIVYDEWLVNRQFIVNRLYKSVYKNTIYVEKDVFIGEAFEKIVNYNGGTYKWAIGQLKCPKKERLINENYILVAPIASRDSKSLSKSQTIQIIDFLLENTTQNIVLTANADKYGYFEEIVDKYKTSRLTNLAGKTNFEQYTQLIDEARLLIGCDSGSIHMAASLDTPSIAICGQWSGAFLPYTSEGRNLKFPQCFWSKQNKPCRFCLSSQGGISSANKECYKRVLQGENRLCLEEADLENVFSVVMSIIKDDYSNDGSE